MKSSTTQDKEPPMYKFVKSWPDEEDLVDEGLEEDLEDEEEEDEFLREGLPEFNGAW